MRGLFAKLSLSARSLSRQGRSSVFKCVGSFSACAARRPGREFAACAGPEQGMGAGSRPLREREEVPMSSRLPRLRSSPPPCSPSRSRPRWPCPSRRPPRRRAPTATTTSSARPTWSPTSHRGGADSRPQPEEPLGAGLRPDHPAVGGRQRHQRRHPVRG
jgi:hypothetical protein